METIVNYFADIPSSHRSIFLVTGLALFFIIENALPLLKSQYHKGKHTGLNLFFTVTTILVNFSMAFLLLMLSDWVVDKQFGVLQWLSFGLIGSLVVGLLLLDFIGAWLAHWVQHHVPWMWQFHVIHHTDQHVDTTTANRHHPGESVIRFGFTILAVIIVGAPMWLVFLYQSLSVLLSQFNHANIGLTKGLDKILTWFICTPNMHHVHHHYRQPYSDTNYGNIFPYWDRIFGTYVEVENKKLKYGLDTHMEKKEAEDIWQLLKIPFLTYRGRIEYKDKEKL